jgi:hypothetical protein
MNSFAKLLCMRMLHRLDYNDRGCQTSSKIFVTFELYVLYQYWCLLAWHWIQGLFGESEVSQTVIVQGKKHLVALCIHLNEG